MEFRVTYPDSSRQKVLVIKSKKNRIKTQEKQLARALKKNGHLFPKRKKKSTFFSRKRDIEWTIVRSLLTAADDGQVFLFFF